MKRWYEERYGKQDNINKKTGSESDLSIILLSEKPGEHDEEVPFELTNSSIALPDDVKDLEKEKPGTKTTLKESSSSSSIDFFFNKKRNQKGKQREISVIII